MKKTPNKLLPAKRPNFIATPELHEQVKQYCRANGLKMQFWTEKAITAALSQSKDATQDS